MRPNRREESGSIPLPDKSGQALEGCPEGTGWSPEEPADGKVLPLLRRLWKATARETANTNELARTGFSALLGTGNNLQQELAKLRAQILAYRLGNVTPIFSARNGMTSICRIAPKFLRGSPGPIAYNTVCMDRRIGRNP